MRLACIWMVLSVALLDTIGRALSVALLWRVGAHTALLAIALCALSLVAGKGALLWLFGVALFALANWLRGSAGVPPDAPLVLAEFTAAGLLAWGARRASAPPRSPAGGLPPPAV